MDMRVLDGLLEKLQRVCGEFPDKRLTTKHVTYSMTDIGMSAFAMFFMQCGSFLDFQRKMALRERRSNLHTLFGVHAIPTDPHIRSMLDEVEPTALQASFGHIVSTLDSQNAWEVFHVLDRRILVALDGTEYFCSKRISCPRCLHRNRRDGTKDFFHAMLGATIVVPHQRHAVHLLPEFIENGDGGEKQDCERNAAKRWFAGDAAASIAHLRPIYLGDDLFACQPVITALHGADFCFVAKESSHPTLYANLVQCNREVLVRPGPKGTTQTYRWANDVPLTKDERLHVNWCELVITSRAGELTYKNAFVTSLALDATSVEAIVECGRTRWKIENESFNVLKHHGYHLAHNYGHGTQHLAKTLATLNLLAFSFHAVCDVLEDLWQRARTKAGKRTSFFTGLFHACDFFLFASWQELFEFILFRKPPASLHASRAGP